MILNVSGGKISNVVIKTSEPLAKPLEFCEATNLRSQIVE